VSVRHPKALEWEHRLKGIFDRIDADLEREYGNRYPLHPVRAAKGKTSNPAYDGLFNVGAAFSAGYGSKHGPGYVVRLRVATLSKVPRDVLEEMEDFVVQRLRQELPNVFPKRVLKVTRDGPVFKIYGDLSLGVV
jgi:hypothetical protein